MSNQLKIDKLKSVFNCKYCANTLNIPITIPCGITICQSHLTEIIQNQCRFCDKTHKIPIDQFKVNEAMMEMLNLKINSIKLSTQFEICNKIIIQVKSTVHKIDQIQNDPEHFIYEYFEAIKVKVDIRREILKQEIDTYSDKIIHDINKTKTECIDLAKKVNQVSTDKQNLKNELNELYHNFDSFNIDDRKYNYISAKIRILQPKLEDKLQKYKNSLLKNEHYSFNYKEISIQSIFGQFLSTEQSPLISNKSFDEINLTGQFSNSNILYEKDQIDLAILCNFASDQKWNLLYRGSDDGFSAYAFHSKCDNIRDTLTIVKTLDGKIFGGYTSRSWTSINQYTNDPNAFIFELKNKEDTSLTLNSIQPRKVIHSNSWDGPSFGDNHDFRVIFDQNSSTFSFGNSYGQPNMDALLQPFIFCGSKKLDYYQATEIEIFNKRT